MQLKSRYERRNYLVGLTMIVPPPGVVVVFLPKRMAAPAAPAATKISHQAPAVRTFGAESGRRQGWQPVCERLPAVADVPAAICLSEVPSRMVTEPDVVSAWVCEHSTSTLKTSAWPASAITVASFVVIVVALPLHLKRAFCLREYADDASRREIKTMFESAKTSTRPFLPRLIIAFESGPVTIVLPESTVAFDTAVIPLTVT